MSSFLFEKEQVNCACFQNSPQNVRRIFRSASEHSANNGPKEFNDTPVKQQTPNSKPKKKSLKKQKPFDPSVSPSVPLFPQQNEAQPLLNQIPIKNDKKQLVMTNFEQLQTIKPQKIQTQRSKESSSQNIIHFLPSFPSQKFVNSSAIKTHSYTQSHHQIAPNYSEQYDKLVQQEFKRDLDDFKLKMEVRESRRNPEDQKALKIRQKHYSELPTPSIKVLNKQFREPNRFNSDQFFFQQFYACQKNLPNNKDTKTQYVYGRNHPLDRIDSLQMIPQQKIVQKSLLGLNQVPAQRQRKESFTTSTIMYKEKQLQNRKIKHKMHAKEIQSQKDGSSSHQSDKMSEVVGRGWDGLTQQKIELQELDDLLKRKDFNHSETMVTQESHIKNSQIKTFTDFSNSFISPKSHKTRVVQTSTAFGNGGKYGMAGISYQNIDQLQRLKSSAYEKLHF